MRAFKVRDTKGQTFDVDEDKVQEAEKDGFLPVVSNGQQEHRVQYSDLSVAEKDGFSLLSDKRDEVSKPEAFTRGITQDLSLGFADEITGALQAGADVAIGDKDIPSLLEQYKQRRDESRAAYKEAERQQPGAYEAGEYAGLAVPLVGPGLKAAKVGIKAIPAVAKAFTSGTGLGSVVDAAKAGASSISQAAKAAAGDLAEKLPKSITKETMSDVVQKGVKQGAKIGAVAGAGYSEKEGGDILEDVKTGTVAGGVLGGTLPAATKKIGEVAGKVNNAVVEYAARAYGALPEVLKEAWNNPKKHLQKYYL
jgi:hypothetical protein